MTLVFRTPADADSLMPSVRRVLWSIDRDVPIADVRTMEKVVADSTNEPRFRTLLLTAFAALALVLSVVGVAGVIAYAVSRRRQEIGVRVALGATSGRVTSMMLLEGLWPAVAGILVGIAGSFALTRILAGLLFGVTATDLMVFTTATVTLLIAAIAATFIPARRAASVDPMVALRSS
jgi:putative ABC transport system permease protein